MSGNLYIVATPIGNLDDTTIRSKIILENVDFIAVEDTRVTKKFLNKFDIENKLIVYNNFNEKKQIDKIYKILETGNDVALVSDAGTPCISDPGYLLVNHCRKNKVNVFTIPGASSVISALSISGLPSESFYFEGFLPKKKGRKTKFEFLKSLPCSVIVFESPKRIIKTLADIRDYIGSQRVVSIHREMTKDYEESFIGLVQESIDFFSLKKPKGEFVIIIAKEGYTL